MRQCCDHPYLVLGRSNNNSGVFADLKKLYAKFASRVGGQETIDSHSNSSKLNLSYLDNLLNELKTSGLESKECPVCLDSPDIPVLTPCAHLLCRDCLNASLQYYGSMRCPVCRQHVRKQDIIHLKGSGDGTAEPIRLENLESCWQSSSKITCIIEQLEEMQHDCPERKCLFISQWTFMLDLLQFPLRERGVKFVRLDGSLSQKQRERVLNTFENEDTTVMLLSMKAGGLGLNLVWWAFNSPFFSSFFFRYRQ